MKLKTTLAYRFSKDAEFRNRIYETHTKSYDRPEVHQHLKKIGKKLDDNYFLEAKYIIDDDLEDNTIFMLRNTVNEVLANIKVDNEKCFVPLEKVPEGNYTFIIDKNSFIKFFKICDRFVVLGVESDGKQTKFCMFNYRLNMSHTQVGDDEMSLKYSKLFIRLVIFWLFTEPIYHEVNLKSSSGTRKSGKILNDAFKNVTVMDTTWNKIIVRTEEFGVRGHFRLQPCGADLHDRKLIWINPFKKSGYTRKESKHLI